MYLGTSLLPKEDDHLVVTADPFEGRLRMHCAEPPACWRATLARGAWHCRSSQSARSPHMEGGPRSAIAVAHHSLN